MKFQRAAKKADLPFSRGKQALTRMHRDQVTVSRGCSVTGSVDLDGHFKAAEPEANRWDYGLGARSGSAEYAVWIEAHSASSPAEVDAMLRKLAWLKAKLKTTAFDQLNRLTVAAQEGGLTPYRWIYSGRSNFRANGPEAKRLAEHGMRLPERQTTLK